MPFTCVPNGASPLTLVSRLMSSLSEEPELNCGECRWLFSSSSFFSESSSSSAAGESCEGSKSAFSRYVEFALVQGGRLYFRLNGLLRKVL